jgi:type IV pilus assembly protein PilW
MKSSRRSPNRPASAGPAPGFSLVEILVALVAGTLLSLGISQVYINSKKTYNLQEQVSRLQENARYALDRIARDIRMAGSIGCTSRSAATVLNTLNSPDNLYHNFGTRIEGFEAADTGPGTSYAIPKTNPAPSGATTQWAPRLPDEVPDVIQGSDILVVRGRSDLGMPSVVRSLDADTVTVTPPINDLQDGDFVMVADCQSSRVFVASAANAVGNDSVIQHAEGDNSCGSWNQVGVSPCKPIPFPTLTTVNPEQGFPAEAAKVTASLYYLSRRDIASEGPSLYRKAIDSSANTPSDGLVEGVESLQVLYGVNMAAAGDPPALQYLTANAVANWSQVRSVRIGILMRSVDEVRTEPDARAYDVNGTIIDPVDDRRLRQVFTTTIAVRNGVQ